jgi:hypothetical protein
MTLGTALAVERFANVGLHLCRLMLGRLHGLVCCGLAGREGNTIARQNVGHHAALAEPVQDLVHSVFEIRIRLARPDAHRKFQIVAL